MDEVTLDELFSRIPKDLTQEDRRRILKAMREGRERWQVESKAASASGRNKRLSAGMSEKRKKKEAETNALLKDLGLDNIDNLLPSLGDK